MLAVEAKAVVQVKGQLPRPRVQRHGGRQEGPLRELRIFARDDRRLTHPHLGRDARAELERVGEQGERR